MATRQQKTTNYKQIFWCALLVFLILLWRWAYLKVSSSFIGYDIERVQKQIAKKEAELESFSDKPGYDKLQYVQDLENNNHMMPRSDHISAIMEIFWDLLNVDKSDTFNIAFSNFEISLDKIKLDWYVTNLRLLYQWVNDQAGLITKFEELDFLDNISIKTYEKSEWELWYKFTLTANVINNGK
jgi:hypothetical protein